MKKVLFAWIGVQDIKSSQNDGEGGIGAICQAVTERRFDEAVLLSDFPSGKTKGYIEWLRAHANINIRLTPVDLGGDPTDFRKIYEAAKREVKECLIASNTRVELTFHLSPGTPAMATIWVILANSSFPAKLIKSSPEQGLQDVDFPFDIAADYIPELLKQKEKNLTAVFADHAADVAEFKAIIHKSMIMKRLIGRAKSIAPYPVPVLIQGESGTGKELLAKAIHTLSLRKGKFIAINCGAIPEELFESELFGHRRGSFTGATTDKTGYIEAAEAGTLFLDEIGEMPLKIQVKLLRVLQEGTFCKVGEATARDADIRIISATNRNLIEEVAERKFREDLFHRLAVAVLYVPALREREGDLGLLIDHLLTEANQKLSVNKDYKHKTLSASAKAVLMRHTWPGNVRELQNTLTRAAVWAQENIINKQSIEDSMLPVTLTTQMSDGILGRPLDNDFDLDSVIGEVARHYIEKALKESGGNKSKAAKALNFKSYQRLDVWMQKYMA